MIGTVIPEKSSLLRADKHADKMQQKRNAFASEMLSAFKKKVVNGECRYYDGDNKYAIVSRRGAIIWFAVKSDGDYKI